MFFSLKIIMNVFGIKYQGKINIEFQRSLQQEHNSNLMRFQYTSMGQNVHTTINNTKTLNTTTQFHTTYFHKPNSILILQHSWEKQAVRPLLTRDQPSFFQMDQSLTTKLMFIFKVSLQHQCKFLMTILLRHLRVECTIPFS